MKYLLFYFAVLLLLYSCGSSKERNICSYTMDQIFLTYTSTISVSYINDTLTEIKDLGRDSTRGVYNFDNQRRLRFYAFFIDSINFRFSEEYDADGYITKNEGSPLIEYRLWRQEKDTVLFNASLFSLNRVYDEILIVSNKNDTIRPRYLYANDFFSNVKSFSFKLPVRDKINSLVLFAKGSYSNVCTKQTGVFNDTVSFKNVRL